MTWLCPSPRRLRNVRSAAQNFSATRQVARVGTAVGRGGKDRGGRRLERAATAVGHRDASRQSTGGFVHGGHLLETRAPVGGPSGAEKFRRAHEVVNPSCGTHFVKHVTST